MAALLQAIDAMSNIRQGDNGHPELDWSNDMQEKIVQFDFQCVRTAEADISNLAQIIDEILGELTKTIPTDANRRELLVLLYKIIGKTRDIHGGKGEYALSYMMVWIWYKYYPVLAKTALQLFVLGSEQSVEAPYGSWKDMKYFCKYVLDQTGDKSHPLIQYCIEHLNFQLCMDDEIYNSSSAADEKKISLVAKWIPRESSKFGWMYENLAVQYYPEYMEKVRDRVLTDRSRIKAIKKCKAQYRMLLSKLNRHIDTVQIKQTSQNWADINHARTTSITMAKQRNAFLNQKKDGDVRSEDPDRVACAENLRSYLESLKKEGKEVKGKHVGLEMFTAQAQALGNRFDSVENCEAADIINSQWRDNSNTKNADGLGPMIAMVDTSGSMAGDPMNAAVALGCRVAEKSCLGKRVLTFSAEPEWINLDGKETFTDMVSAIMMQSRSAGLNTDFYKALDMILTAIEVHRVPPEDVENMILAIFSDMQIDDNLSCMNGGSYGPNDSQKIEARRKWATMHEQIKAKYAEVGMRLYGRPLTPPHILFWNLRKTSGFPTLSTEAGCSMMSGYDPTVLNMFCEIGIQALREMTPYKMLAKLLDNVRYLPMEKAIREHFAHL
jgi:hypothetical protein